MSVEGESVLHLLVDERKIVGQMRRWFLLLFCFSLVVKLVVVHWPQVEEPIQICWADGLIVPAIDYFELGDFGVNEIEFEFAEGAVDGEGFGGVKPEVVRAGRAPEGDF